MQSHVLAIVRIAFIDDRVLVALPWSRACPGAARIDSVHREQMLFIDSLVRTIVVVVVLQYLQVPVDTAHTALQFSPPNRPHCT
eukprot:COSAG02_NODE_2472_length_8743_cov_66.542573_6_plen_84_part_00